MDVASAECLKLCILDECGRFVSIYHVLDQEALLLIKRVETCSFPLHGAYYRSTTVGLQIVQTTIFFWKGQASINIVSLLFKPVELTRDPITSSPT
jgi:hypothetical protein